MSYAELALIAQEYQIPPPALDKINTVMTRAIMDVVQSMQDALEQLPQAVITDDVKDTLVNAMENTAHTLAPPAPPAPEYEGTLEAQGPMRSIWIDVHQATFDGDMVALVGDGEVRPPAGRLMGGAGSRYEDLGLLGVGGMGEVRKVRERDLNRTLAMKIIKPDAMSKRASLARFVEEAQVSAQLQHPSIIPVHELGRLPDGRYYFTMQEIRGRELDDAIQSVHASSKTGWRYDAHGWSLRQLITALQKACQAVGYAHARGVIHRDLKPSNIMIGRDGEVFVLDWGIAKIKGHRTSSNVDSTHETMIETDRSRDDSQSTRVGAVTGTPAYMPPEQAEGKLDEISARSDVYSLGAILYKILTGRIPYDAANVWLLLMEVVKGELKTPSEIATHNIPDELEEICVRALSWTPVDRYANAGEMADALGVWLDGAKRREKALALVHAARDARLEGEAMRHRAEVLRDQGEAHLEEVPKWAPEEDKYEGWALVDQASTLEKNARLKALEVTQTLHAALTHMPELSEAHAALAAHHHRQHRQAEAERDLGRAQGEEVLLRAHTHALPSGDAKQGFAAYLKGTGALTLVTDPPGAEIALFRFVTRHRRLVPERVRSLGRSPLNALPLEMGSYLLEIHKEGRDTVHYPVFIERGQHWDGVRPGSSDPYPIVLPRQGTLSPDACYVPAGWFWAGGDPDAQLSWPRTRCWVDAFVVQKFPVTNQQYVRFLDDLVAQGREDEALRHAPRAQAGQAGQQGAMIYGRDSAGRFILVPDAEGDVWLPDYPVCMIDWFGAKAYATWQSNRDGKAWRLAMEREFKKAARGVDGRFYPWGDHIDPAWCAMYNSHQGQPLPSIVDSYPVDVSVYGVRGLGGNSRDWCEDVYVPGPTDAALIPVLPSDHRTANTHTPRVAGGGSWFHPEIYCRAATRFGDVPSARYANFGARLARSFTHSET